MTRVAASILLVLVLPAAALSAPGEPRQVKPDRAAINALLDQFIPDVVAGKDLRAGWRLVGGAARTMSHREWIRGNTSVQRYPAKGTRFRGWILNYSYPGDVGFDILIQPTKRSMGAWSFRAEAQKLGGRWKITTWYPVATYAPPAGTQTVLGPNDLRAADSAASSTAQTREPAWVLLVPGAAIAAVAAVALSFAGARWRRRRVRIRAIERDLGSHR